MTWEEIMDKAKQQRREDSPMRYRCYTELKKDLGKLGMPAKHYEQAIRKLVDILDL